MKIVHVSHSSRFFEDFIFFNEKIDQSYDNLYFYFGYPLNKDLTMLANVLVYPKTIASYLTGYINLVIKFQAADKIVLHGLFDSRVLYILFLLPFLLKKCTWFLWGGDLYVYRENHKFMEIIRRKVIRNVGQITTYVKGDYDLAKSWYGTSAKLTHSILYPSNIFASAGNTVDESHLRNKPLTVVVGNSADPQNNHLEILNLIKKFNKDFLKIYLPLSYGNKIYAHKVISKYIDTFGVDAVQPLDSYLPLEEYLSLITSADIAIYAHNRQQGMGNTIQMLGAGKTVYMKSDVSHWQYLTGIGLEIKDVNCIGRGLITITKKESLKNMELIKKIHSKDSLKAQLINVYSG